MLKREVYQFARFQLSPLINRVGGTLSCVVFQLLIVVELKVATENDAIAHHGSEEFPIGSVPDEVHIEPVPVVETIDF